MYLRSTILCTLVLLAIGVQSQSTIYSYTFEGGLEGWASQSVSNSGFWAWTSNGKADQGTYWNGRSAIEDTQNGALVYDGDDIISSNIGDTTMVYSTAIESPVLDFATESEVFIKFNQYFRNYYTNTYLEVSSDGGGTWTSIPLNTAINRNVETSNKDYQIIDISAYAANEPSVMVRFLFEGDYYFWIIDNVKFYDGYPVIETFPSNVGDYLTLHGYPYDVDALGWPHIPKQAVVNFAPGTTELEKEQLRDEYGAIVHDSCVCDIIETWLFLDSLLVGPIGLSSTGPTTATDEHMSTAGTESEIDDIDFNKYVVSELTEGQFNQPDITDILEAHKTPKGKEVLKIAIIDTGIDILHEKLANNLFLSQDIPNNEEDDDENCYPDNAVGWNFVDDNNNASDDHGHGTHVAGIVANNIGQAFKKQNVQLIPYKTHDSRGLANLFDVTCAMYQSITDQVSVVNCSWGFYGYASPVLATAIEQALKYNITIVAATGNDAMNLVDAQQYPACYKYPNLISVGSYNVDDADNIVVNSEFSNFSAKFVDVLAPGVDIYSTVPYNSFEYKTGTSMATPYVAALVANKYLMGFKYPIDIKNEILHDALDHDYLSQKVLSGNVLIDESPNGSDTDGGIDPNYLSIPSDEGLFNDLHREDVQFKKMDSYVEMKFNSDRISSTAYVLNLQGQVFVQKVLRNISNGTIAQMPIDDLPAGLYFLKINDKIFQFAVF